MDEQQAVSWQVGEVTITAVPEVTFAVPAVGLLPDYEPSVLEGDGAWLRPDFVTDDGVIELVVQALVVRSEGRTIVVDTCFGNDKPTPYPQVPPLRTDFLTRLAAAGFPPEAVDTVLCTHLHLDHVGWNTRLSEDGSFVPTFPAAEYLFARTEYEYWSDHRDEALSFTESVVPVVERGLHRLVDGDHRLTGEVWLEPTPGHTPGHVSVHVSSAGERALLTGDMAHHPLQLARPGWGTVADVDPVGSGATRRRVLARMASDGSLLIGTHFAAPHAGRVRASGSQPGEGWWLDGEAGRPVVGHPAPVPHPT